MLEDVCFSIAFARIIHREHDTEQVGGDGVGGGGDGVVTGWGGVNDGVVKGEDASDVW